MPSPNEFYLYLKEFNANEYMSITSKEFDTLVVDSVSNDVFQIMAFDNFPYSEEFQYDNLSRLNATKNSLKIIEKALNESKLLGFIKFLNDYLQEITSKKCPSIGMSCSHNQAMKYYIYKRFSMVVSLREKIIKITKLSLLQSIGLKLFNIKNSDNIELKNKFDLSVLWLNYITCRYINKHENKLHTNPFKGLEIEIFKKVNFDK